MHAYFGDKGGAGKLKKLLSKEPSAVSKSKMKKMAGKVVAKSAEKSDRERTGQSGRYFDKLFDKHLGKK